METRTKGGIIIENIKIGDIQYEFEYGFCIKSEVITLPKLNEKGQWHWRSKQLHSGTTISYLVTPEYSHYGPNLYDYEAYSGCKMI